MQNKNFVDGNKTRNQYVNSQGVFINSDYDLRSDYIKVENNKNYILSAYDSSFNRIHRLYQVAFYDKNKAFLSRTSLNYNTSFSVADESIEYVIVWQGVATGQLVPEYLQLEQGSTATSYVPHQEQNLPFTFASGQRLMQGGELQDGGIYNERIHYIFNGDEAWRDYIELTNNIVQVTLSSLRKFKSGSTRLCNRFEVAANFNAYEHINIGLTSLFVHIDKTRLSTQDLAGFKDWVASNNIEIEGTLDASELANNIIPYNSTQQAQYEAIKNARSYADVTYITSTSDEEGFDMYVEAIGDANKVIDDIDTRLSALESEV